MKTEFDALKNVAGAYAEFLGYELKPETVLSELKWPYNGFLDKVSIKELELVIELAERYAGLCDE